MSAGLSPNEIRSHLIAKLKAIRTRSVSFSFRLVQARLNAVDMPSATGWKPLLEKYEALNYSDPKIDWAAYIDVVNDIHRCSILFSSSAVWLFDGGEADLLHIQKALEPVSAEESDFARHFPYPVPSDVLARQSFVTSMVNTSALEEGALVTVACGKRQYREREPLTPDELDEATRTSLGDFQQLIVVRAGFTQAFDRLVFKPHKKRLELHIDLCCPLNSEELAQLRLSYVARIKKAAALPPGQLEWLNTPLNLFPRIEVLYNSPDGHVISLGHATGTKSIKEERMRGQRLDLRKELFHKHGISAIKATEAFAIKKGWEGPLARNIPSIAIAGPFTALNSPDPRVDHAILEGSAIEEDYEFLMSHLP